MAGAADPYLKDPTDGAERVPVERIDVIVDGMRYHVARNGSGPPVLFLHGFTGSTETWAPFRARVGEMFSMVAVDLPGHGRTDSPPDVARYALDRLADDLAAILDQLGVQRTTVVGYSLGGRAALRFALRHPSRVAGLFLESASPGIADDGERAARRAADMALADAIEREGITAFVDRWEKLPLWESQAALSAEVRERLRAQRLANDPRGLANSLRGAGAGADSSVLDRLPSLTAPTLVLAGGSDEKYIALGKQIASAIPGGKLLVIPGECAPPGAPGAEGVGHAIHIERPSMFRSVMLGFLRQVAIERDPRA